MGLPAVVWGGVWAVGAIGARLAVTSREIIDPLPEQLRPLALPVLERVDG